MVVPRGYAWRGSGQLQGKSLIIFGVSAAAGGGTYIHQWVFSDDGSIHAMLGVSGRLDSSRDSTVNCIRVGRSALPRAMRRTVSIPPTGVLTLRLGGQNNDLFQQLDYTADSSGYMINQTITNITSESQFNISPGAQRFWVVKDTAISTPNGSGQNISFQIVPQHTSLHRGSDAFTSGDVYVTQSNACEQFASHNTTAAGCGARSAYPVRERRDYSATSWCGSELPGIRCRAPRTSRIFRHTGKGSFSRLAI